MRALTAMPRVEEEDLELSLSRGAAVRDALIALDAMDPCRISDQRAHERTVWGGEGSHALTPLPSPPKPYHVVRFGEGGGAP